MMFLLQLQSCSFINKYKSPLQLLKTYTVKWYRAPIFSTGLHRGGVPVPFITSSPPLDSLQHFHVLLTLEAPETDAALQVGSPKNRE